MEDVLKCIFERKAIAVIRSKQEFDALKFVSVIVEGGITCIEITMTTPSALTIIKSLADAFGDKIILGAGTVLDIATAKQVVAAGAKFLVTPIADFELIAFAKREGIPVMTGAFSPTEIYNCYKAGADIVKVFPANVFGISYFKNLRGPFPDIPLIPTGGVTTENAGDWIKAGANAVGVGGALLNDDIVRNKDFATLKQNAEKIVRSLHSLD